MDSVSADPRVFSRGRWPRGFHTAPPHPRIVIAVLAVNFPTVRSELSIQVADETDPEFTERVIIGEAEAYLDVGMEQAIRQHREQLAETPAELEVREEPWVFASQLM